MEPQRENVIGVPLFRAVALVDARLSSKRRVLVAIELACALAIVAAATVYLWQMLRAMATTSLWTDELYSVLHFSGKGPVTVVTDYHAANNHVLFNLLNSLTPGRGSVMPLRARLWSFAAVLGSLALLLHYFVRRGKYLEGALAYTAIAGQEEILDLCLQARGYGLVCFATVAFCLSILRFVETGARRELVLLSALTVVGTYTIPTFIVFAAPLLLLLLAWFRNRNVFFCGAAAALAIVLLYAPIASQLLKEMATYTAQWGESYAELNAIGGTFDFFFRRASSWIVFATLLVALVGPYRVEATPAIRAARLLSFGVGVSFTLFLLQRSSQVRTTFFLVLPLGLSLILTGSALLRGRTSLGLLGAQALALVTALLVLVPRARKFEFTPWEAWLEVARYIEGHFPAGTPVHVPFRGDYLAAYLSPAHPVTETFDEAAFKAGKLVFVDADFRRGHAFNARAVARNAQQVQIPQRRGHRQVIWSVAP